MYEMLPDLFLIPANDKSGFGYSQFVKHPDGNILIPRLKATSLSDGFKWMKKMGGVDYVLISDRHFAGPGCVEASEHFNATMYTSENRGKSFKKTLSCKRHFKF